MNRNDLKKIAKIRIKEAKILLNNGNYDGAYYLSGYVIECGLKACIAKKTKKYDFPDKQTVNKSHTHDLTKLVKTAGLELQLDIAMRDPNFASNWAVVKDWLVHSRYEKHSPQKAKDLYSAITNTRNGVLKWIKHYW